MQCVVEQERSLLHSLPLEVAISHVVHTAVNAETQERLLKVLDTIIARVVGIP